MQEKKQELTISGVASGHTRMHNVRFYNMQPRGIHCMASNKIWHKLALSRVDSGIEIWDIQHAPVLEKVLTQTPGSSVEELVWAGERLFSVGLSGFVVEWDLHTLKTRRTLNVTGNAIWCMAGNAKSTELALGTEEGYINVLDIAHDELRYKQLFDKQEGRVLCCCFNASGQFLVSGSVNALRIWDVASGHALHKMSLGRVNIRRDIIVWSLQVLDDFTIIAGDSRGVLTVWDGRNAAQLETLQVLKADILAVSVDESQQQLVCAGVEPILRIFTRTQIRRKDALISRWVKSLQRDVHDHDVKALLCVGDRLYSGGVDGYLGVSSLSRAKPNITKHGPFLQGPCASVAPQNRLLLLRYNQYLELWRLGVAKRDQLSDTEKEPTQRRKLLSLDTVPEKLLEMHSKNQQIIDCAAISPDGHWLAYSTCDTIRLFRLETPLAGVTRPCQLERVKQLPEEFYAASHLQFSSDSALLFLVQAALRQISIFSVRADDDIELVECLQAEKHIKERIKLFALSDCATYLAVASCEYTIAVWKKNDGKQVHYRHYVNLPRYTGAVTTALALQVTGGARLVAVCADGKIFEYDLENMCFSCTAYNDFTANSRTHCVCSVMLDARNTKIIMLHNDKELLVLEKCAQSETQTVNGVTNGSDDTFPNVQAERSAKKLKHTIKRESNTDGGTISTLRLKFERSYEVS